MMLSSPRLRAPFPHRVPAGAFPLTICIANPDSLHPSRFCFKYNTVHDRFDPWGRNTDLRLCTSSGESAGVEAQCCNAAVNLINSTADKLWLATASKVRFPMALYRQIDLENPGRDCRKLPPFVIPVLLMCVRVLGSQTVRG
jgi:hypothetical protein